MDAGIDATRSRLLDRHGLLDQHDGRDRSGRHDRRRQLQPRAGGRRRQPEPRADRTGPAAVGLAAQVPAGALARPEARPCHARPAQGHQALHPGDRQPHDRPEHGRAHRDHRQGMADRPPGAGRDRAAEPPAGGGRLGQGLLRRPGDPAGRRQTRHHPAQGHLAREARAPAAVVRPHQRQGHADRGQFLAADRRRGGDLGRLVEGPGAAAGDRRRA